MSPLKTSLPSLRRATVAAVAAAILAQAMAVLPAEARVVGNGKLENYCAEEAVYRLRVDRRDIRMLPAEIIKGRFVVNGEAMTDEQGLVTFECRFGKNQVLQAFRSNGRNRAAATRPAAPAGVPRAALNKCLYTFGSPAKVKMVSPLKPGYFEIIMRATDGSRQVACTVFQDGAQIEDWVEMRP